MLDHHRVTPSIKFTGTHLYTWVETGTVRVLSVLPKNTTQCPQLRLEQPGVYVVVKNYLIPMQSNLDYPDLNYLDYLIIWTFFSGPNFFMNIN